MKSRLAREPRQPVRIVREVVRQDLDGDFAVELGIRGAPDDAHAALAELRFNPVVPERMTDCRIGHWPSLCWPILTPVVSLRHAPGSVKKTGAGRSSRILCGAKST